jgi:hypothetical protein
MKDMFKEHMAGLDSPAMALAEITPDDSTDLMHMSRAINVVESGFVQVTTFSGDTGRIFVAAGGVFPVRARRIWATSLGGSDYVVYQMFRPDQA